MDERDAMHFWWDQEKNQYVECTEKEAARRENANGQMVGNAYVPPAKKKKLEDVGTRFDHINDFSEYLEAGLTAVTNTLALYPNTKDMLRKANLEAAIILLKVYRDNLADRDATKWEFNNMLDRCVPPRGVLEQIRKDRVEALKTKAKQKTLNPAPENGPDGNTDDLAGV
jgi:hypothetical protein